MGEYDPDSFPSFDDWLKNSLWTKERIANYEQALLLLQFTNYQYDRLAAFNRHVLNELTALRESAPEIRKDAMLGTTLQYWEDIQRSRKTLTSAARGHEAVHGTAMEKEARRIKQQQEVDRVRASHPDWSWENVKKLAAKNCGVSATTIKRNCVDPKKKLGQSGQ